MYQPLKIGITHGDFNGIGYEVMIKTFANHDLLELVTPIIYGSKKIWDYYADRLNIKGVDVRVIKEPGEARSRACNLIEVDQPNSNIKVEPGVPSTTAGRLAALALLAGRQDLLERRIDAIVTAPINKDMIQSPEFHFTGHTEFFCAPFEETSPTMLFVANDLRVALATMHMPLNEVPGALTFDLLYDSIARLEWVLQQDFGIDKPRIAVLGLNPHAGENGLLGNEEESVVKPVIQRAWEEGRIVFGPYPSDGYWGSGTYKHFDVTLALYHDQGLIPLKLLALEEGVNITCGLPIIRTSPDHGTAYDIAGKGVASETSFRNAIYQAIDIHRHRTRHEEATRDPLKKTFVARGKDNVKLDLSKSVDEE
ncbi:MAG: 4-hydroxythreonine-4-phosphate dehydrogenase PdxA [Porphyromonas sp.]|nr:4-hydroxythreonine-4-phosphate dehydrogenase PdxA [Porphyromonas sp.]